MTATFEGKDTNDDVLKFTIAQDEIQEGLTTASNKVKKSLNVPGFHKGKVSHQVFSRVYSEGALYEDTLNAVLPEACGATVKEAGIDPVSQPKIDVESMEKGQDWIITTEATVKPEVRLGQYKDLVVERQGCGVTGTDVDACIKREQEAQAELVIKEDAAAENGDTVAIDFEGFMDGEAFDGGKGGSYPLELDSDSFIPEFEDQLVGHKSGEGLDVGVASPEDYQAEDPTGKETVFKVTIREVKAKEVPELNDEFAKDVDNEVSTLDELKERYRKELVKAKEKTADDARDEATIRMAVENTEIVELPHVMVHDGVHRSADGFLNSMQRRDISPEMHYQLAGFTGRGLHRQFEGETEMRTRTNLVIGAVAVAESLRATEEEANAEIQELSETCNMPIEQVKRILTEDMLRHNVTVKKAIELIIGTATEAKE